MAAKIQGIPVFEALVEGEADGMVRISLVDDPAVMSNWQKFRSTPPSVQMYSVADEEKRIVRGVVMRADFPIYRRDIDKSGKPYEYYIIYHADTIRTMAEKYLAENRANRVDTMHDSNEVEDVQMVQWFIKDTAAGINPQGFAEDIADGSLFAEFHITNDDVWEQVKDGTFRGFSLEGYFSMRPEAGQQTIDEIVDELAGQFHLTDMTKIERLKEILRAELARQTEPEKFGAITTNRGSLEWDGEEDLKAGDRVYIINEDGNRVDATDGDYVTEDGKTIVVENGVVAEIRDPEAEVAPTDEPAEPENDVEARKAEKLAKVQKMEASFDEKMRRIDEAIKATLEPGVMSILWTAGDDFAVANIYSEADWEGKDYRYSVTWNEDGSANVADPVEVRQAFVPMDFDDSSLFAAPNNEPSEAETELRAEVERLRAELEAARQQPMAKPAHEEVRASATPVKTGNARLDRLAELFSAK